MVVRPTVAVAAASDSEAAALAEAVRRGGGVSVPVALHTATSLEAALDRIGGLLVGGDGGGSAHDESGADSIQVRLLAMAMERQLPVLAVGDGMHAINVALGGHDALAVQAHASEEEDSAYHHIYIAPGSKLAAIVGSGGFVRVNSRHRGGIREAQKSSLLLASAYAIDDGVIEAIESPDHDWVIGVQFRPERRREVPPHFERLFQGLAERAGAGATS